MKNMDVITPVFYVTNDNKNVIKEIERKLDLIIIEDNEKK